MANVTGESAAVMSGETLHGSFYVIGFGKNKVENEKNKADRGV